MLEPARRRVQRVGELACAQARALVRAWQTRAADDFGHRLDELLLVLDDHRANELIGRLVQILDVGAAPCR